MCVEVKNDILDILLQLVLSLQVIRRRMRGPVLVPLTSKITSTNLI